MPKRESEYGRLKSLWNDYGRLVLFVIVLFASDFVWKQSVSGDIHSAGGVSVLGRDASAFFRCLSVSTADAVYSVVHFFRPSLLRYDDITLLYDNGVSTRIVWGCTPVKQIFIFVMIMLFAPPFSRAAFHKLWYVPAAAAVLYGINILRISAITLIIEHHPDWFGVMHGYVFKYLFYGVLFLLWLLWTDVIARKVA